MSKIGIIYFSGTGNTKFVAENIKDELDKNNIDAHLINVEKDKLSYEDYYEYESLIIGGPVYVEKYPKVLFKFIENIPKDYKGKCLIFATQAAGKAGTIFQDFINKMDFLNITYCEYFIMPNNFYNFMFPIGSDEERKKRISNSIERVKKTVDNFLDGKTNFYPAGCFKLGVITRIYKMFYPFIAGMITKRIKIDKSRCINCKLCEKRCPVNAIKIDCNVSFGKDCLLCQRCMSNCPKDAFWYKDKKYIQYKFDYKDDEK